MKRVKECKNCEFNFDGICVGNGDLYDYGEKITDDSKCCEYWNSNLDCFSYEIYNAPRFLRETYHDCSISYSEFSSLLDNYIDGKSIPINIFDAIKLIYGISMVDIAVLLDVTFGVVYRAKTKGFAQKRIKQFSSGLFIDSKILLNCTTSNFDKLKESNKLFWSESNISEKLNTFPSWKKELSRTISCYLKCPINFAREFTRVDKLYWDADMPLDDFTESEKKMINYIVKHNNKQDVREINYFLDIACQPHLEVMMVDKK